MSISFVHYFDETVTATRWKPTSGWIRNDREPGCFFRHSERSVTHRWKQQLVKLVWGPWKCLYGWSLEGDRCVKTTYEPVRDKNGWRVPGQYERRRYVVPAERSPEWSYGPVEERSDQWIEHRFETWRLPSPGDPLEQLMYLELTSASVFRSDAIVALPDVNLIDVTVDGHAVEVRDEFAVSEFGVGAHDVTFSVAVDDAVLTSHLTVHVMSRLRFGVPDVVADGDMVSVSAALLNRTDADVVARLAVADVTPGWFAHVVGEPFVHVPAHDTATVEVVAVQLSDLDVEVSEDVLMCAVSAAVVSDEVDTVTVTAAWMKPRATVSAR